MNPRTSDHPPKNGRRRGNGVVVLVAVLITVRAAQAAPIWFGKMQTEEEYTVFAFGGPIVGNDVAYHVEYDYAWTTPTTFRETGMGGDDRLHITAGSGHKMAVHPEEAPWGVRWGFVLDVIGPPAGPSTYSRAAITPHPRLHDMHIDTHRGAVGVEGDGTGEINGYAYGAVGRHTSRPGRMLAAALTSAASARIYYGDATLILDESDNSMLMGVVLGNADFVELHGAAIRRTEDGAMILDLRSAGDWQDAGGLGIAGGIGLETPVTFPVEFLPDLLGGNAHVELLVGGDVIRGELTEIQPELIVIPEPATCGLLAAAIAGLCRYLKRRRRGVGTSVAGLGT